MYEIIDKDSPPTDYLYILNIHSEIQSNLTFNPYFA